MKKQISSALLGLALTLTVVVAASARSARAVRVQIPFDFVAGERQMPAGLYSVRRVNSGTDSTLLIRSEDGAASVVVMTNTGGAPAPRASLGFRQYGERYFLAEVSVPGASAVREVPKAAGEKRVEREFVARTGAPGKVTVVGSVQ